MGKKIEWPFLVSAEPIALQAFGEARAKQIRRFSALFQASLRFNKALVNLVLRQTRMFGHNLSQLAHQLQGIGYPLP